MNAIFLLLALLGHAFIWIGLVNRLHSVGVRRWIVKVIAAGCFACAVLIPLGVGRQIVQHGDVGSIGNAYLVVCWLVVPATLVRLAYLRWFCGLPPVVRFHDRRRVEIDPAAVAETPDELRHHLLARLPLNEILQLEVTQWTLDVPRLPPALDGLSIVHLSDLHFTGRVGKAYFREVVRTSNELQPDLVCITGDIVDRRRCFDWIDDTLGRLSARHGVYFILGNHDRRIDFNALRERLTACGLVDVGGRSLQLNIGGAPVELIGNERPWFDEFVGWVERSEPHQSSVGCVQRTGQSPAASGAFHAPYGLRIALAHTPDQFAWARKQNADLLLTGHTHGGQIRIPPLGAIFAPTRHGVRYISGVFYAAPTIMHVTRGISGDVPFRWNCRPEIALLRLRAGRSA